MARRFTTMRTATFYSKATFAKENSKFSKFSSKASREDILTDLRNLLPDQKEIDSNKDLCWMAGNSAVAGLVNRNNCAIDVETAIKIQGLWKNRPINIGHDRSRCVGFITDSGFSTFGDNKIISAEEAATKDLFNITITGILWRIAGYGYEAEMAEYYDDSDNEDFHELSISWELGFTDFHIALGGKSLSKAKIITDEEEIKKYSRYLMGEESEDGYVGEGFLLDGTECYMVVTGDPIVLAIGLTPSPAASVRGIVTTPNKVLASASLVEEIKKISDSEDNNTSKTEENVKKVEIIAEIIKKDENNVSQAQKPAVKKIKPMSKITNDEMLLERLTAASVPAGDQLAVSAYLHEQINEGAKVYTEKLEAASNAVETAKQESAEVKQKLTAAETELAELKSQLSVLAEKVEQERKQNVLAARLDTLSEKYDLSSAALKKTVVKQIQNLDDESYAAWLKDDEVGGILLSSHPKKEVVASVNVEEATKALKEAKASTTIPNAQNVEDKFDISNIVNSLTK
jgi:hypothetical protein